MEGDELRTLLTCRPRRDSSLEHAAAARVTTWHSQPTPWRAPSRRPSQQHLRFIEPPCLPRIRCPPRSSSFRTGAIEAMVDIAFWASVRREEGYIPKISLAFLRPIAEVSPPLFKRLASARPKRPHAPGGGRGEAGHPPRCLAGGRRAEGLGRPTPLPPFCFVVEVSHLACSCSNTALATSLASSSTSRCSRATASRSWMNARRWSPTAPPCSRRCWVRRIAVNGDALNVQVQLALSMRRHGRGGILLDRPLR